MGQSSRWRIAPGSTVDLRSTPTESTAGTPGGKRDTALATLDLNAQLSELQARLWAEAGRSLLVVLQAMDAGGKDGTVKHVFSGINPAGVRVVSFKQPTTTELSHDFLWRIHRALPPKGEIGIFNRSHYEDVLVTRVDKLVPEDTWRRRYKSIRGFESALAAEDVTIVKLFLHISRAEQAERFRARLDDPSKRWKLLASDVEARSRWDDYQSAYADAIEQTSTDAAPWFVIPADRKWYRNWAVSTILVETLAAMDPQYPTPEPGVEDLEID